MSNNSKAAAGVVSMRTKRKSQYMSSVSGNRVTNNLAANKKSGAVLKSSADVVNMLAAEGLVAASLSDITPGAPLEHIIRNQANLKTVTEEDETSGVRVRFVPCIVLSVGANMAEVGFTNGLTKRVKLGSLYKRLNNYE